MHDFDEDASIDLTPVIDVIFMLLIFFIMTTTFSKPVLDIVLPASETAEESSRKSGTGDFGEGRWDYPLSGSAIDERGVGRGARDAARSPAESVRRRKAPFEAFVGVVDIARLKRGGHFVISTQPSER